MAKYLGLFLLVLSFNVSAKESKGANLRLRGFVPVSYKVNILYDKNTPVVQIQSNQKNEFLSPKSSIQKINNRYLVSIVHP